MKTIRRAALPLAAALVAAGCGAGDPVADSPSLPTTVPADPADPGAPATSTPGTDPGTPLVRPVAMPDRAAPAGDPTIAGQAVSEFAHDLLAAAAAAAAPDDNVAVSPLSVAIALAMLEPGATGAAQTQLRELLRIDDPAAWHASMNALEQLLESRVPDVMGMSPDESDPGELRVDVANAAFIQPGYPFEAAYLDAVGTNYGAVVEELDFFADQAAAAERINAFIADATDGRITDLVGESDIDPATVLALVNALLLQASWQQQFDVEATEDDVFTRRDGTTVTVPMMQGRSDRSGRGDGWVAATKNLVGSMAIEVVLPDEGRFDEIARSLDSVLTRYRAGGTDGALLAMPRFETRVTTGLTDVLLAMGLTAPFENGNLLGIADDPQLVLDKALHQTWLSIDEEGIEAAAATVLIAIATSAPAEPPVPVVLDRPFLFRILDGPTGATLFSGRIVDPTA